MIGHVEATKKVEEHGCRNPVRQNSCCRNSFQTLAEDDEDSSDDDCERAGREDVFVGVVTAQKLSR